MNSDLRSSSILLLFCLSFFPDAALGQLLSITRKGGSEFLIEAAAPAETRYLLQASGNLNLWVDIQDDVRGESSYRLENAGAREHFFRLTPWIPPAPPITVVLLGDSTVADFLSNLSYFNGWGQGIYGYFKPNVRVVNLAMPGYSSKVFLASAEKTQMLALRPDYVLVQFGLIDEFGSLDSQITTLQEFGDNLRTIVQTIRGFQGTPILITPPVRRLFDAKGKVIPIYLDRFAVIRDVAAELQTHLIDLHQLSMEFVNELGESGSAYLWWETNYLHFSDQGAQVIAGLVVSAFPNSLGTYLAAIFHSPQKP